LGVSKSAIEASLEDAPDVVGVTFVRDLLNPVIDLTNEDSSSDDEEL